MPRPELGSVRLSAASGAGRARTAFRRGKLAYLQRGEVPKRALAQTAESGCCCSEAAGIAVERFQARLVVHVEPRAPLRSCSVSRCSDYSPTYNQMVVELLADDEVDRIFRALADATRRDILRRTMAGEASVSQSAAAYDMSFAAVQKHVAVLEGAGLVTKQPHGRERIVRGNPETIRKAQGLLDRYEEIWRSRIDQLDALLAEH